MTYQNDPNFRQTDDDYTTSNTRLWVGLLVVVLIVVGALAYAFRGDHANTASTGSPPAASSTTTGSGSAPSSGTAR